MPTTKNTKSTRTTKTTGTKQSTSKPQNAGPLYALAGAGDLAVEKLREVGDRFGPYADPKVVQTELTTLQTELARQFDRAQADLTKQFEKGQAELAKRLDEARTGATQLPELLQHQFDAIVGQFETTYEELAGRGKTLVTRIRHQAATEHLTDQAKTTASRAKATRTSARKTTTTTTRSAKATATSAKKTASRAAKAASAAADKVGD